MNIDKYQYREFNPDLNNLTDDELLKHFNEHCINEKRIYKDKFFDKEIFCIINNFDRNDQQIYLKYSNDIRQQKNNIFTEYIKKLTKFKNPTILLVNHDNNLYGASHYLYNLFNILKEKYKNFNVLLCEIDYNPILLSKYNINFRDVLEYQGDPTLLYMLYQYYSPYLIYLNSVNYAISKVIKYIPKNIRILHSHEAYEHYSLAKETPDFVVSDEIARRYRNNDIKNHHNDIKNHHNDIKNQNNTIKYYKKNQRKIEKFQLKNEKNLQRFINKDINIKKYENKEIEIQPPFLTNIDDIIQKSKEPIDEIKNKNGIFNKNKITIGMCGQITKRKNYKLFIEVSILYPNYNFIWIGDNSNVFDNYQNIYHISNTQNPYKYYRQLIDYFMLFSIIDPCPYVILENILLNTNIIVFNPNILYNHNDKLLLGIYNIYPYEINLYNCRMAIDRYVKNKKLLNNNYNGELYIRKYFSYPTEVINKINNIINK
jgi:hypothetical protein